MRKCILAMALILLLGIRLWGADGYVEEKALIEEMTRVMESYIAAIESSDAVETMIQAINNLVVEFESFIPKMKEMAEKNPDWGDNPPEELKETMDRYVEVSKKFFMGSLARAVEYANKHQDNKTLQEAFGKLNLVMSQMGGRAIDDSN